jgi:hypothetical protein
MWIIQFVERRKQPVSYWLTFFFIKDRWTTKNHTFTRKGQKDAGTIKEVEFDLSNTLRKMIEQTCHNFFFFDK